jgi:hypothetical protein
LDQASVLLLTRRGRRDQDHPVRSNERLKALQTLLSRHIDAHLVNLGSIPQRQDSTQNPTDADAPEQPILDVHNQPDSHRPRRTEQ